MEQTICQSCAIPLTSEDMYSTEKDKSISNTQEMEESVIWI